ncbi:MAG: tetratricopeptide repeat protein [Planctomycetes bacterium]|nr:tetratricopeptide repeat protein [Planctomycetota bacterium]
MGWWQKLWPWRRSSPAAPRRTKGCDGHSQVIHLRQGTPEFEQFIAEQELSAGTNLSHGAFHLANLLALDPGRPPWIALLRRYGEAIPDFETLIPRDGASCFHATEALRAFHWQRHGRVAEAIDLLSQVVAAKPDVRYLEAWVWGWVEPEGQVESLPEPTALLLFGTVLNRHPEVAYATAAQQRDLARWLALSERYFLHHLPLGAAGMVRVGLMRKGGRLDEALALARQAHDAVNSWHSATALGLVLRSRGQIAEADDAFRCAADHDPADVTALLESGDMFLDARRWAEAESRYALVLERQAGHAWADPSLALVRWRRLGEQGDWDRLVRLATEGNTRASTLVATSQVHEPPEPADASASVLRQLGERRAQDPGFVINGTFSLTLSSQEAPSTYLALRMQFAAWGWPGRVEVTVQHPPGRGPDPRVCVAPVDSPLWRYQETDAEPALPLPAADAQNAIAELAAAPWDEARGWAAASRVAERLGPTSAPAVLAVLVHPPALPADLSALHWLPRVQIAAMQVLAQIDDGPWIESVRRSALRSALLGPQDWCTAHAVRAMTRLAVADPTIAPDVHAAFTALEAAQPHQGYWSWVAELYANWMQLPHLFPEERERLRARLAQVQAEESG